MGQYSENSNESIALTDGLDETKQLLTHSVTKMNKYQATHLSQAATLQATADLRGFVHMTGDASSRSTSRDERIVPTCAM